MSVYKLIAIILAYGALWDALSRWRVRAPERRLQLQLYGCFAAAYVLLVVGTGGASPAALTPPPPPALEALDNSFIRSFFGAFSSTFLLLGSLEIAISMGFQDPSMPLLGRWWVRALFEGPVWRLLRSRQAHLPMTPAEAEASFRHAVAGLLTVGGALWSLQIALGGLPWGWLDPVAFLILLKALNVWWDARIWSKTEQPQVMPAPTLGYAIRGEACSHAGMRAPRNSDRSR